MTHMGLMRWRGLHAGSILKQNQPVDQAREMHVRHVLDHLNQAVRELQEVVQPVLRDEDTPGGKHAAE